MKKDDSVNINEETGIARQKKKIKLKPAFVTCIAKNHIPSMANLIRYRWRFPQKKQQQKKSATVHYKLPLLQEPACTKLMGNYVLAG